LAFACSGLPVSAQNYPTKPVKIVVPYPPGGFNDTLGRTLAAKLPAALGQPVIVDNRPGAGTIIGTELVARAPADGYTLLINSFAFTANPGLYGKKLNYDPVRDFAPITHAASTPNILVVHPSVAAKNLKQLIALAKAKPGALNYGTAGNGSSIHLAMELLKHKAGIDLKHIPYKGSAPAVQDLLAGHIQLMFDNVPNVLGHIKAGKLRALAVSGTQALALLPDLPTIAQAGVPDFDVTVWFGLLAPAGTPPAIVARLNRECVKVLADPEVRSRFAAQGVQTIGSSSADFAALIRAETQRWTDIARAAGVSPD
jgi:tripartite-type tricarboxylate transporter receptor subunit TctC